MIFMSKLRVLFDAGPMLGSQKTGVGYYVSRLMTSLQETHSDNLQLTGYYFNFLNRHGNKTTADTGLRFRKIRFMPGKLLSACRRLGFQPFLETFVRQKSDAIIFTNYVSLPQFYKRKTVLVIYDLSFLDVPEFTQSANLAFLKRFCPPSIKRADTIITISEFTKERIKHYFPNLKADIIVTPIPPIDRPAGNAQLSDSLSKKGVEAGKYILYLGTIEPRKNLETLVAAYAALNPAVRQDYSLVLAGGQGWKDEGILAAVADQQSKGANIIMTGYVSEEEKNALYANAACFVLPSHYEGFGMPIFEAMQHGVPVAVSDIAVFHEVAGKAAAYFDKSSPEDMADKVGAILNNKSLRDSLVKHGRNQLKIFSWQENADKVYRAVG
jgi:glycosyltransferase involved in cell wall biosynthesis